MAGLTLEPFPWDDFTNCSFSILENNRTTGVLSNTAEELIFLLEDNINSTFLVNWFNNVSYYNHNSLRMAFIHCLQPPRRPFSLPWYQKLFWIMAFSSLLGSAIVGNLIVMWIVLAHRRMRTVTNYFLVNLSLSDLLMATMNGVFNSIFMIESNWLFGPVYCTLSNFMANVSVSAGVFTLTAISLDRFLAIVRPLRAKRNKYRTWFIIVVIWLSSALLALPTVFYSTIVTKKYANDETRTGCFMQFPDGMFSISEYVYNMMFLTLTYLLPLIAMGICYFRIGKELWWSQGIGEQTQRQIESVSAKKKIVRMLMLVVIMFAICWLPYHLYFIYTYYDASIAAATYVQHLYLTFYWLAMSNATINPFIYYWMNNRFRQYFRSIVCCCCIQLCGLPVIQFQSSISQNNTGKTPIGTAPKNNSTKPNGNKSPIVRSNYQSLKRKPSQAAIYRHFNRNSFEHTQLTKLDSRKSNPENIPLVPIKTIQESTTLMKEEGKARGLEDTTQEVKQIVQDVPNGKLVHEENGEAPQSQPMTNRVVNGKLGTPNSLIIVNGSASRNETLSVRNGEKCNNNGHVNTKPYNNQNGDLVTQKQNQISQTEGVMYKEHEPNFDYQEEKEILKNSSVCQTGVVKNGQLVPIINSC